MQSDFGLADYHAVVAREEAAAAARALAPKKKMRAGPEDALQIEIARLLRYAIAPPAVCNSDGAMWWAIEQASSRPTMRTSKTGQKFDLIGQRNKAKGCRSGIADLHFLWLGNYGVIELKAGRNTTSDNQDAVLASIKDAGGFVAVCWSVDEVIAVLRGWSVPLRVSA